MTRHSTNRRLTQTIAGSFAFVLLAANAFAGMSKPVDSYGAGSQKTRLRRAEVLGDQMLQRFHESLDFARSFRDHFVTEPQLRVKALAFAEDKSTQFGEEADVRQYVSILTGLHLVFEYRMVQDQHEIPPEVEKLYPKLRLIDDPTPPKNLDELNEGIAELDNVSAIYRKYLPPSVFSGALYRETLRKERAAAAQSHRVPRIEAGNAKFQIPASRPVYIVRPELFDYYFVEENGAMKLFYVDIFPDFKLF